MGGVNTTRRTPGRPRSTEVDEAIAQACRELLVEGGYPAMTIESVAERAGVTRPTIYRRWPSKSHMVWDVIFTTPADAVVIGDTDDLRGDVELWVSATMAFFGRPEVARAFPALLTEQPLEETQQARLRDPVREQVAARLRRAVREGELHQSVDPGLVFDMVVGLAVYRGSVPQGGDPKPAARVISDQVLLGMILRP
jgi:AcrR family transcriptional regulator